MALKGRRREMNWGWLAFFLSLALAVGGGAATYLHDTWWTGLLFHVGIAAFVGCATNKIATAALFDPWPSRRLRLPGTGVIRGRADKIAREVGRTVGERILTPEYVSARSAEAIQSAVAAGRLDSDEVFFAVRRVIEDAGGIAGKVGHLTGVTDYDVLTHKAIDSIKEHAKELKDPASELHSLIEKSALAIDVPRIVREKLLEFGPQGMRDLAYDLSREHLVWLEVWGAVFGGAVGVPVWWIARYAG
jgi:uncharacterized membrane protein YheB (UPF0754 family)